MKKSKKIALSAAGILLLLLVISVIYVSDYYHADDAALAVLESDTVSQSEGCITFFPSFVEENAGKGFIFYPGGKVEHAAYAPLMQALAEKGILCVLVEMPLHLAVLDVNAADGIQEQFPQITQWYIGGHSLGGSMAASYISENTEKYEGLVLLASYSTAVLSESDLKAISVYGTEDHVLNLEKYRENLANLPEDFTEYLIEGGCHAYFGSYGAQSGDGIPAISPEEQICQTVCLLMDFFY